MADWMLVHLRPQSFYDFGHRPAGPWWNMKGYPAVPCTKATAGEQMVWCLPEKGRAIWGMATKNEWLIKFKHVNVEECVGKKAHAWKKNAFTFTYSMSSFCSPEVGSGWIIAPVFYSPFLRLHNPTERQERGKTNERDGNREAGTPVYDSQTWTTRQWEGENESPSFLLLFLHHLSPLQVGTCERLIRDLSAGLPSLSFSPSTVCRNSAGSNLTLSNGRRLDSPLRDTGTSWETTTI